ncbi:class I SAM-dependent methyltransferase [Oleidesulfovibrio alaskensis]|uniref:class I SAM-dependent methyltransferase n=1 Tax=Oleidesulfovibrio alaskensis TaxID=58180 RepID=UPI0003FD0788|nr:class I SAM-dependent methyltransferase [Oleidesulfovibrio alaskensis]
MHTRDKRLTRALGYLLRKPVKALKAIHRDRFQTRYWQELVCGTYDMPDGLPVTDILDLLGGLDETVQPYAFLEASATVTDIALLKALARRCAHGCSYLEVGRWRGESLMNVAAVARSCVSVSLSAQQMRQAGFSDSMIAQDGFFLRNGATGRSTDHITCIDADTQTFDFSTLGRRFDLIFIDGDHHSEAVARDTRSLLPLLRDENSVMVWHDYAQSPEKPRWAVLAGILQGMPAAEHRHLYHVSNTLCALYTRTPLHAATQRFAVTPRTEFSVRIQARKLHAAPPRGETS